MELADEKAIHTGAGEFGYSHRCTCRRFIHPIRIQIPTDGVHHGEVAIGKNGIAATVPLLVWAISKFAI